MNKRKCENSRLEMQQTNNRQIKYLYNTNGITLIALVITIIVMLILAGVSLNATIGENGILTQAKNATYMQGIAALEEYLQTEYIKYYDDANEYSSKLDLLIDKNSNLCLKNGIRNYTIYDGKMYYLINKQALPEEIRNQLRDGNSNEISKYARLIDVYGVTADLKVYYCANGLNNVLGNIDGTLIDPNTPLLKIKSNANLNEAMKGILTDNGVEISDDGITYGNVLALKELTIDGSKYKNISNLNGISEFISIKKLILKDLTLTDLNEIESLILLSHIEFQNCTIQNYSGLAGSIELEKLYLYNPPSNIEVEKLSKGLSSSNLKKLTYFGIYGYEPYKYTVGNSDGVYGSREEYSNITDISSLNEISDTTKNSIKNIYLNNNKIYNISSLKDFKNLNLIYLMCNPNLESLNGLEEHGNLHFVYAQNCNLKDLTGLNDCGSVEILSVANNKLINLSGIENLSNLNLFYANNNDLNDISALAEKENLQSLNLKDNSNLINITPIIDMKSLQYLYLIGNNNMDVNDIQKIENILSNCIAYSIPDKYLKYFLSVTQYDYTNSGLNDYSEEIQALKNRSNVTYLRLAGNTELGKSRLGFLIKQGKLSIDELEKIQENLTLTNAESNILDIWKNYTELQIKNMSDSDISTQESENDIYIRYIISTMTGLEKLSILGNKNITSIDFVNKVTNLIQLDLRNTVITDLSKLESNALNLDTLAISNPKIDMKKIQATISRLGMDINRNEMNIITNNKTHWGWATGLVLSATGFQKSFKGCDKITSIRIFAQNAGFCSQTIDLLDCESLSNVWFSCAYSNWILPSSLISINIQSYEKMDATKCVNLTNLYFQQSSINSGTLDTFVNSPLQEISMFRCSVQLSELQKLKGAYNSLTKLNISNDDYGYNAGYRIDGNCNLLSNFHNLKSLTIYKYNNSDIINGISKIVSLEDLNLSGNNIGNINELTDLNNLTTLRLVANNISDITALSNLKNLSYVMLNENCISNLKPLEKLIENENNLQTLYLNNNNLENYVTQNVNGQVILIDNIEILKKMNKAGLKELNISGNSFQDTSELKKLQWNSYND